jgi:hypothetical protein
MVRRPRCADKIGRGRDRAAKLAFHGEEKGNNFRGARKTEKPNFVPGRKMEVIDSQGVERRSTFRVYRVEFCSPPGERAGFSEPGGEMQRLFMAVPVYHKSNKGQEESEAICEVKARQCLARGAARRMTVRACEGNRSKAIGISCD